MNIQYRPIDKNPQKRPLTHILSVNAIKKISFGQVMEFDTRFRQNVHIFIDIKNMSIAIFMCFDFKFELIC